MKKKQFLIFISKFVSLRIKEKTITLVLICSQYIALITTFISYQFFIAVHMKSDCWPFADKFPE